MDDEAVVRMARAGYAELQADVDGDLPDFDDAMTRVRALYRSLPWAAIAGPALGNSAD